MASGDRFENGFGGMVAVVTGGGTGMGRELVRQLTAEGCDVATCDVIIANAEETAAICSADGNRGQVLVHEADVSSESDIEGFAVAVAEWRSPLNLLFNNAGIGGGGTIIAQDRDQWERVFNVCWYGVYYGTLHFVPQMLAAPIGQVVNTSSINGFFASIGPGFPHSSYSAAKFAVKGFTEALITDFALNAPNLSASVVMPGHIGTSIQTNSDSLLGFDDVDKMRQRYADAGRDASHLSDDEITERQAKRGESFRDRAPTSAAEAATIILDGVRRGDWRILVGEDAVMIDELVRADPENAYTPEFYDRWVRESATMRLS